MTDETGVTTLEFDFDDLPDEILPVSAGIYHAVIIGVPTVEERHSERTGKSWTQLNLALRITDDGDEADKVVFDNPRTDDKRGQVKIKRLCMSAGLMVGNDNPLVLADLEAKDVVIQVTQRTYTDSDDNKQVANNVKDYLTEGEGSAAGDDGDLPEE